MTAITFPNNPSSGDTHTAGNGIVYTYDGEKWTSIGTNSAGTWTRSGTEVSLTNAGDDLNVDSGTLFVDASTDRVGIGTTSPGKLLEIGTGGVAENTTYMVRINRGVTGEYADLSADNGFATIDGINGAGGGVRFLGDGTERARINGSGNVGIGTVSPSQKLDVSTGYLNFTDNYGIRWGGATSTAFYGNSASNFIAFQTGSNERMRIDSSGRVGIQNSSPGSMSPGADDLVIGAATGDVGITLASLTSGAGNIFFVDSAAPSGTNAFTGFVQYDHGANNLNFGTGTALRTRIDSNGTVKSSTSTSLSTRFSGNIYHLSHNHNDGNTVAIFEHSGGSTPYGIYIQFSQNAPDNNTQYFISCEDTTTHRFYVYSDGDVVNHDNSYGAISDVKLKQDIVDSGSQWDDLKNLRVRKFKFKSDVEAYGNEAKTLIGLVAQEAELVSPGLVKENPDTDSDNNDLGTTTKSVNYSVLYMKAIKALQEAMERIETLEQRLTDAGIA